MIGVVADDTTGALDIGVMFRCAGRRVQMFTRYPAGSLPDADVTIVDTDSRLDPPALAYEKVFAATRRLRAAGCSRFHKKTCSVFRGNIGREFDAMMDALACRTAIISLAYPQLGRTTIAGRHYVHGTPLEQTGFARDPVHPRRHSDLAAILAEQSSRASAIVPLEAVRAGPRFLRAQLEKLARTHAYLVVDGETPGDLRILAEAAENFAMLGGSAGLAIEWPTRGQLAPSSVEEETSLPASSAGVFFVNGSLTAESRIQVENLRRTGIAESLLRPAGVLDEKTDAAWTERAVTRAVGALRAGAPFLLYTPQDQTSIAAAQAAARNRGWDGAQLGRAISQQLADLVARVFAAVEPAALIVAGGDTSGAICRKLGITGCHLLGEIDPGVPACLALGRSLVVVLKSGCFGGPDFYIRAAERVQNLGGRPLASSR